MTVGELIETLKRKSKNLNEPIYICDDAEYLFDCAQYNEPCYDEVYGVSRLQGKLWIHG